VQKAIGAWLPTPIFYSSLFPTVTPTTRPITYSDVAAIAAIHAASWRNAYRGILRDEFLDGDILANRVALWEQRLSPCPPEHFGFLAYIDDQPVGFTFAFGNCDARWGTMIDNLHVLPDLKSLGIGRSLLTAACIRALQIYPQAGLHLWVFEQNTAARRFYERIGGQVIERVTTEVPGGGEGSEWLYAWPSTNSMLVALDARVV
jgi:GNAT superfamily N-acetyltransferase